MLSYEEFENGITPLRAALESRRRKYLRYFYAGLGAGVLLLAASILWAESVLHGIQQLFHVKAPLKSSDVVAFRIFALLLTAALAFAPIISYRGARGLSIEQAILTRLFSFFGTFISAAGGGIPVPELKNFAAAPFLFYPEEGVSGEMNGVRLRLCEASLLNRGGQSVDRLVFHGLMILGDWPRPVKMTGNDRGKADMHGRLGRIAGDREPAFLAPRWDERALYAGAGLYGRIREGIIGHTGKDELPSERLYRLKYYIHPRLTRHGQPRDADAEFLPYTVEYAEQNCLILIGGLSGFFSLGSLFAPAFAANRLQHFYEVMQLLDSITRHMHPDGANTISE